MPYLLSITLGDPQHLRDDLDRERPRPLLHEIEGLRVADLIREFVDDPTHHRLELGYGPGGEHPAHERPHPLVLGRVHEDDHAELESLGIAQEVHVGPVATGEHRDVLVGGGDVLPRDRAQKPYFSLKYTGLSLRRRR